MLFKGFALLNSTPNAGRIALVISIPDHPCLMDS